MHQEVKEFFGKLKRGKPGLFEGGKILEIGSLNINGSVREFFSPHVEYAGVDPQAGAGVDIQAEGTEYTKSIKKPVFDFALSTETFEHAKNWKQLLTEMFRVTKPGGIVAVTMAGPERPKHSWDGTDRKLKKGEYYGNVSWEDLEKTVKLLAAECLLWELDRLHGDIRAAWVRR